MATSGSVDYAATRDDIITESLQICGVVEEGGSPSSNQLSDCARSLNWMIKAWMADGLQLWLNTKLVVFPVKNQRTLTFAGSGGDRMCLNSELITTQLNGSHASGATSLTVDSTTGMAMSDVIGVVTDDSGIHWTTISSVDTSTTLTIASGLASTASDNDRVYTYTNAFTQKVPRINNAWIRTNDNTDIPIDIISRQEYTDLSLKGQAGRVNQIYFEPLNSTSVANVWPVPDDSYTNDRIYMYVTRYVEDYDAASNDSDFPQEVFLPLAWGLATYVAPKYGVTGARLKEISSLAFDLKEKALDWDTEDQSIFIVPADQQGTYRR